MAKKKKYLGLIFRHLNVDWTQNHRTRILLSNLNKNYSFISEEIQKKKKNKRFPFVLLNSPCAHSYWAV